jgi:16S rRNA (adenine1518-N6/adenine1519-N6)-dimethyltransferase
LSAEATPALPPLREVARRYGIAARRRLGQHFLFDLNLTWRIARAAGRLDHAGVVEIGAGPGGLTRALLAAGARSVVAVERDRRCLAALDDLARLHPGRLTVVAGDALALDPCALVAAPRKLVGNLPYNIATTLLLGWLDRIREFESLTLMFQREVALRLVAAPGSKCYGRLGVLVQWLAETQILFDVPAAAFVPPPKVTSSVVAIQPRREPLAEADKAMLERVAGVAFGRRRKMLRSSLEPLGVLPGPLLDAAGIAPTARPEELSIAEFCRLARAVATALRQPILSSKRHGTAAEP